MSCLTSQMVESLKMALANSYPLCAPLNLYCKISQPRQFCLTISSSKDNLAAVLAHILGDGDNELCGRLYKYTASHSMAVRTAEETRRFANIADTTGTVVSVVKGTNMFRNLIYFPFLFCFCLLFCVADRKGQFVLPIKTSESPTSFCCS